MMAKDPKLREEFERKIENDPKFAANPYARLSFFYDHSPWYAANRIGEYPVGRLDEAGRSAAALATICNVAAVNHSQLEQFDASYERVLAHIANCDIVIADCNMKLADKVRYLREVEGSLRSLNRAMTQQELLRAIEAETGEAFRNPICRKSNPALVPISPTLPGCCSRAFSRCIRDTWSTTPRVITPNCSPTPAPSKTSSTSG